MVHRTLLRLVHLKNDRGENVLTGFYLPLVKSCMWHFLSALLGCICSETHHSFSQMSHTVTSEKLRGRKQIMQCSWKVMVSGYLFKETGWQCNGWSKLENWAGKRSENVRGDKINDQCSPPSEMLLFFGAFYSVQSVRVFNIVAKLSPYKGELVRTGFCPYYYNWSWGSN